jgi:hypothetical protein
MKKMFVSLVALFSLFACQMEKYDLLGIEGVDVTIRMPETYFSGGFDSVRIDNNRLVGENWEYLENNDTSDGFYFHNIPDPTLGFQEIRTDPTNSDNRVLYQQVVDDPQNASGQRAQVVWDFKENLDVYHISYRIYLHPDINNLSNYPSKIVWFVIMEMWEEHNPDLDGDGAGQARWGMSIRKDLGTGKSLFWAVHADYMQPQARLMESIWPVQENRLVPVKTGQWATLDYYLKRGQGKDGHLMVTIQYDGESVQTLFDIHNYTEYPGNPLPVHSWNVWKLYTADPIMDFMRNNNATIGAYYDDFKWYKN